MLVTRGDRTVSPVMRMFIDEMVDPENLPGLSGDLVQAAE